MTRQTTTPATGETNLPARLGNLANVARRTAFASLKMYRRVNRPPSPIRLLRTIVPNLKDPVFLIGAPRSGTTFLGECLSALPEISYHFEPMATKAGARYVIEGLWTLPKAKRFYSSVYRWLMRLHMDGDLRFAEKTPRNCFVVPFLMQAFPDAQFIHILRDGRDCALSLSKKPWLQAASAHSGKREPGGYLYGPYPRFWVEKDRENEFRSTSDIHRCIWSWRQHTEAALQNTARMNPQQLHELRYESLVASPRHEARRIADFLRIDSESSRQRFYDAANNAHPSSVGGWRRQLDNHQINQVDQEAGTLLSRLGYK
jgi:sulfotransferase family protein